MFKPKFKEDKTTQAAALFLSLADGKMKYLKLIKLLYILDREALLSWGRPVTFDSYVSMNNGPVLSNTYNLIIEEVAPGIESYWRKFISEPEHYFVKLLKDCPTDELSEAELGLLKKIFKDYKDKTEWDMVEITHEFEEWEDPEGSAIPIEYSDILKAGHKTDIEIKAIENELDSLAFVDRFLS